MQLSKQRIQTRGAPDFGANENDFILMKQQIQQLTLNNNAMAQEIQQMQRLKVAETTYQNRIVNLVLIEKMIESGHFTKQELDDRCKALQMLEQGLEDKAPGSLVEDGDTIIMKYQVFDGDAVVDDQTKHDVAYKVGCKGFPCDDGMIGMQVGESRFFDVVFTQGQQHLLGKNLRMVVSCRGIKIQRRPA